MDEQNCCWFAGDHEVEWVHEVVSVCDFSWEMVLPWSTIEWSGGGGKQMRVTTTACSLNDNETTINDLSGDVVGWVDLHVTSDIRRRSGSVQAR